ncbi:MAG TPA: hypothetical protein VHP30_02125, partial [Ignavibacteriales bacterium]|nr:hypothetical protein [Ignavibacteriales bacterium]
AVNQVFWKLTDLDRLENDILNYVGAYLLQNEANSKNKSFIKKLIYRRASASVKRNQKERIVHFADLGFEDDSGEIVEFDPVDVLANVDARDVITKETTTLLAKDDRRKEFVLNAWLAGFSNDSELSFVLADEFKDTQPSGHRSFIKRFRNDCRTSLSSTAI